MIMHKILIKLDIASESDKLEKIVCARINDVLTQERIILTGKRNISKLPLNFKLVLPFFYFNCEPSLVTFTVAMFLRLIRRNPPPPLGSCNLLFFLIRMLNFQEIRSKKKIMQTHHNRQTMNFKCPKKNL